MSREAACEGILGAGVTRHWAPVSQLPMGLSQLPFHWEPCPPHTPTWGCPQLTLLSTPLHQVPLHSPLARRAHTWQLVLRLGFYWRVNINKNNWHLKEERNSYLQMYMWAPGATLAYLPEQGSEAGE